MKNKPGFFDILFGGISGSSTHKIPAYRYLDNLEEVKTAKLEEFRRQRLARQFGYRNMYKPMTSTMRVPEFRSGLVDKRKKK